MGKIYTRGGDDGRTGLLFGGRVPKHHPAVEAYGTVDELQAHLGLARALCGRPGLDGELLALQKELFSVSAELSAGPDQASRLSSRIGPAEVARLEAWIDRYQAEYPFPRVFVLPGRTPAGAAVHLARTVCRRAERLAAALLEEKETQDSCLLRYLNRLSDLLFAMAWALDLEDMAREALGLWGAGEAGQ